MSNGIKGNSRSSKSGTKKKTTISIYDVKFKVYKSRTKGYCDISVSRTSDGGSAGEYKIRVGIVSCWVDPTTNFVVKAHLVINTNDPGQLSFLREVNRQGEVNIGTSTAGVNNITVMAERQVLRYGVRAMAEYHQRGTVDNEYRPYFIYDSKALAIMKLLDQLKLRKTIGGLSMVNFSKLPDELLQGVGYEAILDVMLENGLPRGVPMWKGDPAKVMDADAGHSYYAHEKEAANAQSFLELIQGTIQ